MQATMYIVSRNVQCKMQLSVCMYTNDMQYEMQKENGFSYISE